MANCERIKIEMLLFSLSSIAVYSEPKCEVYTTVTSTAEKEVTFSVRTVIGVVVEYIVQVISVFPIIHSMRTCTQGLYLCTQTLRTVPYGTRSQYVQCLGV